MNHQAPEDATLPPGRAEGPIDRGEDALQAACRLLLQELGSARALLSTAVSGRDVEALHDYRVSLRRARSLLSLLKGVFDPSVRERLADELRSLAKATGRSRDLDVQLEARDEQLRWLPEELVDSGQAVFDELARLRDAERVRLHEVEQAQQWGARLDALLEELGADALPKGSMADQPIGAVARDAVRRRYRSVRKRGDRLSLTSSEADVHTLRIACKKLRYALELFRPVLDGEKVLRKLRRRLKHTQTCLGEFNDHHVQRAFLLHHFRSSTDADILFAVGALVGGHQAELAALRRPLLEAVDKLLEPELRKRVKRALGSAEKRRSERGSRRQESDSRR